MVMDHWWMEPLHLLRVPPFYKSFNSRVVSVKHFVSGARWTQPTSWQSWTLTPELSWPRKNIQPPRIAICSQSIKAALLLSDCCNAAHCNNCGTEHWTSIEDKMKFVSGYRTFLAIISCPGFHFVILHLLCTMVSQNLSHIVLENEGFYSPFDHACIISNKLSMTVCLKVVV